MRDGRVAILKSAPNMGSIQRPRRFGLVRHGSSLYQDNGADITNLAINFYLKRSDIDSRGFEFTHKSFGDYLAARAIIRVAFDIGNFAEKRVDAALKEWFDITGSGRLSHEVLDYIEREFKLLADNLLERPKVSTG